MKNDKKSSMEKLKWKASIEALKISPYKNFHWSNPDVRLNVNEVYNEASEDVNKKSYQPYIQWYKSTKWRVLLALLLWLAVDNFNDDTLWQSTWRDKCVTVIVLHINYNWFFV